MPHIRIYIYIYIYIYMFFKLPNVLYGYTLDILYEILCDMGKLNERKKKLMGTTEPDFGELGGGQYQGWRN